MFKYWKIAEIDDYPYPWIYCPEMDNPHKMGTIREGYREFKRLEEYIRTITGVDKTRTLVVLSEVSQGIHPLTAFR